MESEWAWPTVLDQWVQCSRESPRNQQKKTIGSSSRVFGLTTSSAVKISPKGLMCLVSEIPKH